MSVKFSVIIPMYNSSKTILKSIQSVINQTYEKYFEIIVINDGSFDGCEKIVEDIIFKNNSNRTIKLVNKQNGGVSSARNAGIKIAAGEYLAFLDSDDMWHPQKLEIISKIIENENIKFVGHNYTLVDNSDVRFSPKNLLKVPFIKLLLKNFAVTPSIVIKRDICEYFNEKMQYLEDHDLWLKIALKVDVYYLDLPLTILGRPQLSSGGLSSNKWAMRKGELQMYTNIIKYKKKLIFIYPLLILFSFLKYLRIVLKDLFKGKLCLMLL